MNSDWLYKNQLFSSDDIGDYIGFVYIITEIRTNKKYVGKKLFKSTRRLPPLKGKKRRRTKIVESDWKTYFGSSEHLKSLVEEYGHDSFRREILQLCHKKGEMSYYELYHQIVMNVLLDENYYNGIIQCKIHRSHVKNIKIEDLS